MKNTILLTLSALALNAAAASAESLTETRAYYSTNPDGGVGKAATITIDGSLCPNGDWYHEREITHKHLCDIYINRLDDFIGEFISILASKNLQICNPVFCKIYAY